MPKRIIAISHNMKGVLDNNYILYDDGTVLHEYDEHIYPGGQNLNRKMTVDQLSDKVKQRLLEASSEENKDLVRKILKLE
jgi:hypothetical protein